MRAPALTGCVLALCGCTAHQGYDFLQQVGRSHAACESIRDAREAAQCEAAFRVPYRIYRDQRERVLEGDALGGRSLRCDGDDRRDARS